MLSPAYDWVMEQVEAHHPHRHIDAGAQGESSQSDSEPMRPQP
jgi:hypothetical protein